MPLKGDIEIAQQYEIKDIRDVAKTVGIGEKYLEIYGRSKTKVDYKLLGDLADKPNGRLALVTAVNPTLAGEGRTTISVGLIDGLRHIDKKAIAALREPSLGPVFGVKNGVVSSGHARVVPMEDINLHFTGGFHAIGAANNLLTVLLDNHIYQGNKLCIDPKRITWKHVVDMNDHQPRNIVDGPDPCTNGVTCEGSYDITVASEIMMALYLSSSIGDMKEHLGKVIIGYTYNEEPVTATQFKAKSAMYALLKDVIRPNLVQTLGDTPALIHSNSLANIAHGCSSLMMTRMALKLSDCVVIGTGFSADLGTERFLDIKCRTTGIAPNAVIIIATARVLEYYGGVAKPDLNNEDLETLEKGILNLFRHVESVIEVCGLPRVVVINRFPTDTKAKLTLIRDKRKELGVKVTLSEVWIESGAGAVELAEEVVRLCEAPDNFSYIHDAELSIKEKLNTIVQRVYHGNHTVLTGSAVKQAQQLEQLGFGDLLICMVRTQYSLTDDAKSLDAPGGFEIAVKSLEVSAGAGFIAVLIGDAMTILSLSKESSSEDIDVDESDRISGLF